MELALVFCCLLGVTAVYGNSGFYFPDEVDANAKSESNAWSDGNGNAQANSNAVATGGGSRGGSRYPEFYKPPGHGHGGHGAGYPSQGFTPVYERPPPQSAYEPRPSYPSSHGGQSNANANSQSFGNGNTGSSLSNAIANSNSLGPNGESSAAAAAASAGTSFVNGIPVSSAAASAAAASSHGNSQSTSSANSGLDGSRYPGSQYPRPQYPRPQYPRPSYPGNYDRPSYYENQPINPWQYRSGASDDATDSIVVEADTPSSRSSKEAKSDSKIIFKD